MTSSRVPQIRPELTLVVLSAGGIAGADVGVVEVGDVVAQVVGHKFHLAVGCGKRTNDSQETINFMST